MRSPERRSPSEPLVSSAQPTAQSSAPVAYYDSFVRRLLRDYMSGNPRASAAVLAAVAAVPDAPVQVLDIGCGIGWSTFEIARQRRAAHVLGVDLSPALVDTAATLFGGEARVRFVVANFLDADLPTDDFDVAALLDVYEHFPASARGEVHARLRMLLKRDARIVLTTPTVEYQRYLRTERPELLQPIDEDVTFGDLEELARCLGGRVASFDTVSIWRRNDYQHAVIERGTPGRAPPHRPHLEPFQARRERVRRQLGLRWTATSGLVSARGETSVCIATLPVTEVTTETFVRAHLEHLPARIVLSDECRFPPIVSRMIHFTAGKLEKNAAGVERRLFDLFPAELRGRLYASGLLRERCAVVLAEFGPNAVAMHAACRRAGIPLVTHFHGYDAFRDDVIHENRAAYASIFADGWPVVAVSESMKRQLVELGARPEQVRVIRYGIDVDRVPPPRPIPGMVVAVGRLVEKKAPDVVVRAFARTADRVPAARLVMIGGGPLREKVERLVVQLGLEERVRLEGVREHGWVMETLSRAAVFVQHSVVAANGDREGTPVAVLEACAAAVPVVGTRHEGIAEVVVDGETGILVDERDVDATAEALVELLLDEDRARRLGLAGRERVRRLCSRDAAIRDLWGTLQAAISNTPLSA